MYKYMVKTYMYVQFITPYATVDLSVSVFSTVMHSSSLMQVQVDFCTDINYLLSVHSTSTIT